MNRSRNLIWILAAVSATSTVLAATLVVPMDFAATPAPGAQAPFGGVRYQNIYNSANFLMSVPEQMIITSISFRLDESRQNSLSAIVPDLEVRMGTAKSSAPASTLNYASNVGTDYTTVFRAPLSIAAVANPGQVNPFSIAVPLQNGFYYAPHRGGLVLDLLVHEGTPGVVMDADGTGLSGFAISGPLSATIGSGVGPALIVQFGFEAVPEPNAITIGALYLVLMFLMRRRERNESA